MSKISHENLKKNIKEMLEKRKQRKFIETVELQVGLRDYDPEKDKRFTGSIKLPACPHPRMTIAIIGSATHCEQAKKAGIPCIDVDGLKQFNKEKKKIKQWARPFDTLIASEPLMKLIPRLLGNVLVKIGKFPITMSEGESVVPKVEEVKSTVRFQLKKVLCLGTAVATADMTEEQIRQNINMSINFLISLLKKGWNNIRTLHIKTTMGPSVKIYG
eukprot:TRINITY_DN701_c0_g1_i16.p1 TRINITY_DN701_c0_g1~~TRINITY_DN701_c0_g1_i16.p1  ORF type:complete len:216 (-),score=34.05 TRINITY_DN701_c0_g1_i16:69-716(-)